MRELIIGLYVICALALIAGIVAVVLMIKRSKGASDDGQDRLKEYISEALRSDSALNLEALRSQETHLTALNQRIDKLIDAVNAKFDSLKETLLSSDNVQKEQTVAEVGKLKDAVMTGLDKVREANHSALKDIKDDNARQLQQMREVVDEKLSSTLDKRFNQSFKIVGDRLEEINRSFTELQGLQSKVGDLSKILSNVKTRGGWGEVSLENLLSQILAPSQYERQKQLRRGSKEAVDFAIRLPGKGDGNVYLPIDSKFPLEDYARLQNAEEASDIAAIEEARKAIFKRIKSEAMSIRDKYIDPPLTTNFAVMYLPIEGLYAEVLKNSALVESIQHDYRIVICGPTTVAALLNSLQMGFQTLAVEKQSKEIGKLLKRFESDFAKFVVLLRRSSDKLGGAQKTIEEAEKRADKIQQSLAKINLPEEYAAELGESGEELGELSASDMDEETV